jgi:hypothetical protein
MMKKVYDKYDFYNELSIDKRYIMIISRRLLNFIITLKDDCTLDNLRLGINI